MDDGISTRYRRAKVSRSLQLTWARVPAPRAERGQDPVAAEVGLLRKDQVFQGKEAPHPVNAGCGNLGEAFGGENWGCGQCPHFGSRPGPYRCRTGPYSACFRGSPVFAGAGTRFGSHLGHVFSLFRGLFVFLRVDSVHTLASDLILRVCGVPDRPIRLWGSG